MDQYGYKYGFNIGSWTIAFSQLFASVGVQVLSYATLLISVLFSGLGFQLVNQSKNIVMATLFLRKELSFANNALASLVSCISFLNGVIVPILNENRGLLFTFYFGVILCLQRVSFNSYCDPYDHVKVIKTN